MRLSVSKSKNSTSLYVIQSIYDKGKRTTRVVEKLGTVAELQQKLNGQDPIEWAKSYIEELNKREEEQSREVIVRYSFQPASSAQQQFLALRISFLSAFISEQYFSTGIFYHSTLSKYY